MILDLVFPVRGEHLPTDHAYPLYAAVTAAVAAAHDPAAGVRFAPITGTPDGPGRLRLADFSRLRLRLPDDRIRDALPLAGRLLDIAGHHVRLGVPTVEALTPAAAVWSPLTTFKNADTPEQFLAAARSGLAAIGVAGEAAIPVFPAGPRVGEARRRVVRIKGVAIVGYALTVTGLTASDALELQKTSFGGRTRIGCGFFMPVKTEGRQ